MFTSISALCQELGLDPAKPREELQEELAKRRSLMHADKTGGEFASKEAEAGWHRVSEALNYLQNEQPHSLAIASIAEVSALSLEVRRLQNSLDQLKVSGATIEEQKSLATSQISKSYRTLKIGSGTFAAICASILAFSEKLNTNPLLSPLTSTRTAKDCLLLLLIISGLAFTASWINEHRLKGLMDFLLSDDGLATSLYWCLIGQDSEEPQLTKRELANKILDIGNPYDKSAYRMAFKRLIRIRVTNNFAEKVADVQIAKLVERSVINRQGIRGIEPLYGIERSRADEIKKDRYAHTYPRWF